MKLQRSLPARQAFFDNDLDNSYTYRKERFLKRDFILWTTAFAKAARRLICAKTVSSWALAKFSILDNLEFSVEGRERGVSV